MTQTRTRTGRRLVTRLPAARPARVGEVRQDLVTGTWVVVATARAKRPDEYAAERRPPAPLPVYKEACPFCNLVAYPQAPDVLQLPADPEGWLVHVFPNKYPAFMPRQEFRAWQAGPYRAMEAVGYHEVLATRWHNQQEVNMTRRELTLQLEAVVMRYRQLAGKPSVNYIQVIKNFGERAGQSIQHPHLQILTTPVLPTAVHEQLLGAERYAQQHGVEVFGVMVDYERQQGARLVYENDAFVAFCPFASRVPFEVWVVPKQPEPYFQNVGPGEREQLADALGVVLRKLYHGLHDPPYNYWLFSAPCDDTGFVCNRESFKNWRWHIQILPRVVTWGGFEASTGLPITPARPEESAAFMREQAATDR